MWSPFWLVAATERGGGRRGRRKVECVGEAESRDALVVAIEEEKENVRNKKQKSSVSFVQRFLGL